MIATTDWKKFLGNDELADLFENAKSVTIAKDFDELVELSLGSPNADSYEVAYDVPGKGRVVEVTVDRCPANAFDTAKST